MGSITDTVVGMLVFPLQIAPEHGFYNCEVAIHLERGFVVFRVLCLYSQLDHGMMCQARKLTVEWLLAIV